MVYEVVFVGLLVLQVLSEEGVGVFYFLWNNRHLFICGESFYSSAVLPCNVILRNYLTFAKYLCRLLLLPLPLWRRRFRVHPGSVFGDGFRRRPRLLQLSHAFLPYSVVEAFLVFLSHLLILLNPHLSSSILNLHPHRHLRPRRRAHSVRYRVSVPIEGLPFVHRHRRHAKVPAGTRLAGCVQVWGYGVTLVPLLHVDAHDILGLLVCEHLDVANVSAGADRRLRLLPHHADSLFLLFEPYRMELPLRAIVHLMEVFALLLQLRNQPNALALPRLPILLLYRLAPAKVPAALQIHATLV